MENFCLSEKAVFSAHIKPTDKKSFFQRTTTPTSHRTQTNAQSQILSATTYCELAVKQLFFEKHQSCVCTTVTLSHRFKAFSPAFCRQNRFRHVSPEVSAKSLPAELWIEVAGRSPACFLVTFCTMQKVTTRSPSGEFRGFANLDSAHKDNNFVQSN